jgi:hypothetical protein
VYVWRRRWTPAARQALVSARGGWRRVLVLAAELGPGRPTVRAPDDLLVPTDVAVLRLGPWTDDVALVTERLAAEVARVPCRTVQLDVDVPSRALDGYARVVHALRRHHPGRRVEVTGLPDWLRAPGFAALRRGVDAWTLQVHTTGLPSRVDDARILAPVDAVERWLGEAKRSGPVTLALPTYAYRMQFDPGGAFLGLVGSATPRGRWREVWPDPVAVQRVLALHPDVVWFRLPMPDDSLAWSDAGLRHVRAGGDVVAATVEVSSRDVVLRNPGPLPVSTAGEVRISGVVEGVRGFVAHARGLRSDGERQPWLAPGERRVVGWAATATRGTWHPA